MRDNIKDQLDKSNAEAQASKELIPFIAGFAIGGMLTVLIIVLSGPSNTFKVGSCVRELGHKAIETVVASATGGAIETTYDYTYSDGSKTVRSAVYDKLAQERLVKVNCK